MNIKKTNYSIIFYVSLNLIFSYSLKGYDMKRGIYFPKLTPSAKLVKVINKKSLNDAEFLMTQSLIGLVALNSKPSIIIDPDNGKKGTAVSIWKKELEKYGYSFENVNSPWKLLSDFKNRINLKGYILCKLNTKSINVATSLSGILNGLVIDESLESKVKKLGLKLLMDVRDKSENWCFEKYKDRFNKVAADRVYKRSQHNSVYFLRDYMIAVKGFCFWDNGRLRQKVLKWLGPDNYILGWGPGEEYSHVGNASLYGVMRLPSDWSLNMSFFSSVELPIKQIRYKYFSITNIEYNDKYTHYITFLMTDGDNISWFQGNSFVGNQFWASPYRGKFPLGWTVSSLFSELSPQIESYINSTKSPDEGFVAALSGNGYFYPDMYGKMVDSSPFNTLSKSVKHLNKVFKINRLEMLQLMDYNYDVDDIDYLDVYTKNIDNLLGLFWIKYDPYDAGHGKIRWGQDKYGHYVPLISSRYIVWKDSTRPDFETPRTCIQKILKLGYPPERNMFTAISVNNWSWKEPLKAAFEIYNGLKNNKHIKFVRPEELIIHLRLNNDPEGVIRYFLRKYSIKNIGQKDKNYTDFYKTVKNKVIKTLSQKKYKSAWDLIKKLDRYYQKNN